jgi:hypothetical protein
VDNDVMISIDPHKASNTAAVLDPATKAVIASRRFANTTAGYRQLRTFGDIWQQRRWAVEGCHGAGRLLAQHLVADGELVLDVPAKLAARVRVDSQGHGRKTDADDAVSIGLAALNSDAVAAARADDTLVSLRLLCDRRDELTALRTQAVCRLHRLLVELTPGGTHRGLRAARTQQLLAKLRPVNPVAVVRVHLAHQHLDDIGAPNAKMKTVREQIAALVEQSAGRKLRRGRRLRRHPSHAGLAHRARRGRPLLRPAGRFFFEQPAHPLYRLLMPLSTSRRIAGGFGRQVFLTELEPRGLHLLGLARPHPLILTGVVGDLVGAARKRSFTPGRRR